MNIDRINKPTREQYEEYILKNQPFIITGVVNNWISFEKWIPSQNIDNDYFLSILDKDVPVREIGIEVGEWLGKTKNINFSLFWKKWREHYFNCKNENNKNIENNNNNNNNNNKEPRYYLASLPIQTYFKELIDDFEIPEIPKEQNKIGNLWIGFKDQITPLHHDWSSGDPGMDGLHAIIIGKKLFKLFDPILNVNCFKRKKEWGHFHQSEFDFDNPDFKEFPEAKNYKMIEIELNQGEMLFIPKLWWHHVKTLEPSISINFWFQHIGSELLKCNLLWCHMEQYLNAVLQMDTTKISNDKFKKIINFLTNDSRHNGDGGDGGDGDIQQYKDDPLKLIQLPKFINSFSNAVNNPIFKNHPKKDQFKFEITEKVNQWIEKNKFKK
ncbi:hypothetical protein RB653_000326 [Dictyostelium firmibasis]|uniref:JmjC domain-containing protein n=1 Tax=Dictyostelium firmibasis TaxID=79012 RepID=A0AAN7Z135_9MYCE